MREILLAGEKAHERPALVRDVIAHRSPQHWIAGFKRVEDRTLRHWITDLKSYFTVDTCQGPQMCWEYNPNHSFSHKVRAKVEVGNISASELLNLSRNLHLLPYRNVWTSTDNTAGKSLTIGSQLSPPLADP